MNIGFLQVSALSVLALGAQALTGCKEGASGEICIGEFASLTGTEATFGISSHEGTVLAVEKLNASGGVLGRKVKLLTEDNESKAGQSQEHVRKLIKTDRVVAVLGEVASSRSLEAAPICQDNQVPQISPASTNPKVTETGGYIFRVCFTDAFQAKVMANLAKETLKTKRIAILTDVESSYSRDLSRLFKEEFAKAGGEVAAELDYRGGANDFKRQLEMIKLANPESIFVPGYYADAALICIQAKVLGVTAPIFGGDGWESDKLIEMGKEAVNGTYLSSHFSPQASGEKGTDFVAAYKARYNAKEPDSTAALGYDSAMLLFDAFKRAGTTEGTKVCEAIALTKDFDGVTGNITINKNRDADKSIVILQVKNGKFMYVNSFAPAER
jgi:branched-chain amino acid transport system substrate-binding protein